MLTASLAQSDPFGCTAAGTGFREEGCDGGATGTDFEYRESENSHREREGAWAYRESKMCCSYGSQLADSMKRFNYLLGQTELFQHFIDLKVSFPARSPGSQLMEPRNKESRSSQLCWTKSCRSHRDQRGRRRREFSCDLTQVILSGMAEITVTGNPRRRRTRNC